jgi:hypothetical protein
LLTANLYFILINFTYPYCIPVAGEPMMELARAIFIADLADAVVTTMMISSKADSIRIRLHHGSLNAKCQSADKNREIIDSSGNIASSDQEDL